MFAHDECTDKKIPTTVFSKFISKNNRFLKYILLIYILKYTSKYV